MKNKRTGVKSMYSGQGEGKYQKKQAPEKGAPAKRHLKGGDGWKSARSREHAPADRRAFFSAGQGPGRRRRGGHAAQA